MLKTLLQVLGLIFLFGTMIVCCGQANKQHEYRKKAKEQYEKEFPNEKRRVDL